MRAGFSHKTVRLQELGGVGSFPFRGHEREFFFYLEQKSFSFCITFFYPQKD